MTNDRNMNRDARIERWDTLPTDHPMPLIARQRIIGDHVMVSRVTLEPGFFVPAHHHSNEQFVVVMSGHARFTIGAAGSPQFREVEVRGGDVLVLPPHVPHSCRAIERTEIMDLFSPPSEKTGVDEARG